MAGGHARLAYEVLRELKASSRSEVFLVRDMQTGEKAVLKTPSINYRDDARYLVMEGPWRPRLARRCR